MFLHFDRKSLILVYLVIRIQLGKGFCELDAKKTIKQITVYSFDRSVCVRMINNVLHHTTDRIVCVTRHDNKVGMKIPSFANRMIWFPSTYTTIDIGNQFFLFYYLLMCLNDKDEVDRAHSRANATGEVYRQWDDSNNATTRVCLCFGPREHGSSDEVTTGNLSEPNMGKQTCRLRITSFKEAVFPDSLVFGVQCPIRSNRCEKSFRKRITEHRNRESFMWLAWNMSVLNRTSP